MPFGADSDDLVQRDGGVFVEWNERNHRTITVSHYGYRHTVRVSREKWAKVKSLEDVSRIFRETAAKTQ